MVITAIVIVCKQSNEVPLQEKTSASTTIHPTVTTLLEELTNVEPVGI